MVLYCRTVSSFTVALRLTFSFKFRCVPLVERLFFLFFVAPGPLSAVPSVVVVGLLLPYLSNSIGGFLRSSIALVVLRITGLFLVPDTFFVVRCPC